MRCTCGASGAGRTSWRTRWTNHPAFELVYAAGESSAGSKLVTRFPGVTPKLADLVIEKWDPAALPQLDVLFASLPTERLRTAPPATPTVNGTAEALLTVRVPFEERDLAAGREEFACHRTQYTPAQMDAVNRYLAHAWNGTVWLRPYDGRLRDPNVFAK